MSKNAPARRRRLYATLRKVAIGTVAVAIILATLLGFGINAQDIKRMRAFGDAVRRWQHDPDFRAVQREYVAFGVDAMRAHWWGLSGERVVMGFRSLPGLPLYLKAAGSSAAHYRAFSEGEIPAYLHLTSEQSVEAGLGMIEDLGRREPLTDGDIIAFLDGFKLPAPIVTDAGAIASVRRLLADTQSPPRSFARRGGDIVDSLRGYATTEVASMTQLDDAIRAGDPELWRTKQVADFLSGIWAQGYGQIYNDGIAWLMRIRTATRIALLAALALMGAMVVRSHCPGLSHVADGHLDHRRPGAGDQVE
jgi:hypothetical protein